MIPCIGRQSSRTKTYLELLFRTVFAFPKASRRGFDCKVSAQDDIRKARTSTSKLQNFRGFLDFPGLLGCFKPGKVPEATAMEAPAASLTVCCFRKMEGFPSDCILKSHLQYLLLNRPSVCICPTPHVCQILHNQLCCLRFASSTFPAYKNGLTLLFVQHGPALESSEEL